MVFIQLLLLTLLTFVLLSPLLIKSSSREIVLKEVLLENPYRLARVRIFKCMDHLEGTLLSFFISYMFLVGFFLPILLITVFYALMMKRLFKRSRSLSSSKLPVNRIAGYTIAISVFFVLCWSPYWISMLYFNFVHWESEDNEKQSEDIFSSDKFIYIMYGVHALPYVNSASNWLLYGLLNSQLMRRAKYTNETFYNNTTGMPENGFGSIHRNFNGNTTTPPPPSQIRIESSRNSSLAVTSKLNGNGRCNSTLSTPLFGGCNRKGSKQVRKSTINGQIICHENGSAFSPSLSSQRSISSVSAPLRTITFSSIRQPNNLNNNLNNEEKESRQRLLSQEVNNDVLL
uniref:G-protein coupled receptors family 1 profile domain-containing protein n=1 Tax=Meloidogyne enterolobii TaxID=390850 RepID=A0A6V7WF04_MELEN|nr:unnamed protein product [Meloidogyne enterolobii]